MLDFLIKHKRSVVIGGIVALILVIVVSVYFIIEDGLKTANVSILVAPSSAVVKINDDTYKSYGDYRIRPGEYTVEISAEGFETKTGELKAIENETAEIRVYLEPSEGNEDYYKDNPVDGTILGDLKAAETMKKIQELAEKNPILNSLPIKIDYYTKNYAKRVKYDIVYTLNADSTDFVIDIKDYTGGNYKDALEKIRARGYNPEDFVIQYENLASDSEWGHAR